MFSTDHSDIVRPGPVSAIALLADKVFMILNFAKLSDIAANVWSFGRK